MLTRLVRYPAVVLLAATLLPAVSLSQDELTAEQQAYIDRLQAINDSLEPARGRIVLGDDLVTLTVPEEFYFLDADDAETVLVDLWGNPPGQAVLGMLIPNTYSAFDENAWAVTIEWTEDGYVSDEDAAEIDYDELLRGMQKSAREADADRIEAGYEPVRLLGWAERPHFDADSKKLYWAKELKFGDAPDTTLNYEIRALGRRGILSMTFIAATRQLEEINRARDTVLAMAEFNDGHRYADFSPDVDKVAAYGIGALVAGNVAAKTGLLATGLVLIKKFGVFALLGLGLLWRRIAGLFRTQTLGPE